MHQKILTSGIFFLTFFFNSGLLADDLIFNPDISTWIEEPIPDQNDKIASEFWKLRTGYSDIDWNILENSSKILASDKQLERNPELPKKIGSDAKYLKVSDGWLVGYNKGEWGGSLYWFNPDGTKSYEISKDQLEELLEVDNQIYAIQGLSHLDTSEGSLLKVKRDPKINKWYVSDSKILPQAPLAFKYLGSSQLIIALYDSVIITDLEGKIIKKYKIDFFSNLYANSLILSKNKDFAYFGMRQFVGELNLKSGKFRYLIPSRNFLHKFDAMEREMISNDEYLQEFKKYDQENLSASSQILLKTK